MSIPGKELHIGPSVSVQRPADGPAGNVGDGRLNRDFRMVEAIDDEGGLDGVPLRNAKRA